ncbi:MAG TPA: DUF4232 domain-containing protein, partial [Jatrophihabitans sp.]|nr:DUF4232 domain-containing protein [Jatrophihabitans sp.]
AVVVVLVAVGLTIGGRVLNSSRPNRPANHPRLTPPPPNGMTCSTARDETLVDGAQTSYPVPVTGERRYVFEYYCAGLDGHRTGSALQVFRMANGQLQFLVEALRSGANSFVLSLSGGDENRFQAREATKLNLGVGVVPSGPGAVVDESYRIEGDNGSAKGISVTDSGLPVARVCDRTDLTVRIASAQLPTPHLVLGLTNTSTVDCALWGNPSYAPGNGAGGAEHQQVRYVLRGPAGGVNTAPSAPVILLRPDATAYAGIGLDSAAGSCSSSTTARVTLPDGVDLGLLNLAQCNFVSYPLVIHSDGDDSADHPTVPRSTAPISCMTSNTDLTMGSNPISPHGNRAGVVLTLTVLSGRPCTLSGYLDVQVGAADSSQAVLAVAEHTPNGGLGGLARGTSTPPLVTLTGGQVASALVEWSTTADHPGAKCFHNGQLGVQISTGPGPTSIAFGNTQLSQFCDLTVHPIVPGDTGSQ